MTLAVEYNWKLKNWSRKLQSELFNTYKYEYGGGYDIKDSDIYEPALHV